MRSLTIEKGLAGQVHFPGEVNDPTLPLAVMDLYISINVGAITGLAGMEAAFSGLPVIAMQWTPGYRAAPEGLDLVQHKSIRGGTTLLRTS